MKIVYKMRAVAFSAWIFINLIILAMCGYVYLLWSQYWLYVARHQHTQPVEKHLHIVNNRNVYANQVIYFNQEPSSLSSGDSSHLQQTHRNQKVPSPPRRTYRRPGNSTPSAWPRHRHPTFVAMNMSQGQNNWSSTSGGQLDKETSRILAYRNQLMVQLRRVLLEESSVFKTKRYQNPYNVKYNGPRGALATKTAKQLLCKLKASPVRTIVGSNTPFNRMALGKYLPKTQMADPFVEPKFNTCAVVTNAGSLYGSGLGSYIDSHEAVMRFNHAPTIGHEQDVGTKTTIRVVNSQVVTKEEFTFQTNPLYQGVMIVAWDPSNYSASLEEWHSQPEYDVFSALEEYLSANHKNKAYLIDPRSVWSVWDLLQQFSSVRLRRNPPSSGFLGIILMLAQCRHVSVLEYVPSVRLTKRCHYWETTDDSSCTFGVWHPLAAEKLMTIVMNTASEYDVYQRGIVTLPGFYYTRC